MFREWFLDWWTWNEIQEAHYLVPLLITIRIHFFFSLFRDSEMKNRFLSVSTSVIVCISFFLSSRDEKSLHPHPFFLFSSFLICKEEEVQFTRRLILMTWRVICNLNPLFFLILLFRKRGRRRKSWRGFIKRKVECKYMIKCISNWTGPRVISRSHKSWLCAVWWRMAKRERKREEQVLSFAVNGTKLFKIGICSLSLSLSLSLSPTTDWLSRHLFNIPINN